MERPDARSARTMQNPWLDIPAADYIGHMSSPEVGQHQLLNQLLREALQSTRPRTALILGCSTGNGFEHIDPTVTAKVVGVDINPGYLRRLTERFPQPAFDLDVRCGDLEACSFEVETFDLVHAALILEYVEWPLLLPRIAAALKRHCVLSVVLQLPSVSVPAVTPTRFTSLRSLELLFRFVDPDHLVAEVTALGLLLESRRTARLESGKAFDVLRFRKMP